MISAVNPYPPTYTFTSQGSASLDYLNLALVVETSRTLKEATREFVYSYNPHKLYLGVQNLNNKSPNSFISTYA
jgi:hypothetical protein